MLRTFKWVFPLLLAFAAFAAQAANEIKPVRVYSIVSTKYGQSSQGVDFEVKVANLAYKKTVFVHLKRWDGDWIDVPLQYSRPAEPGYEIWVGNFPKQAQAPVNTTYNLEFALKYVVDGQTYWDNNDGQNYKVASDTGYVLYGLEAYSGEWPSLFVHNNQTAVTLTLKNLAYTKHVRIFYTTTGSWDDKKSAVCKFSGPNPWVGRYSGASSPNEYGFEEWFCSFNVGNASKVKYYFQYDVNDETVYDNNFGHDYSADLKAS